MTKLCIHKLNMEEVVPFKKSRKRRKKKEYKTELKETFHAKVRFIERFH